MTYLQSHTTEGIRIAELGFLLGAVAGSLLGFDAVNAFGKRGDLLSGIALAAGSVLPDRRVPLGATSVSCSVSEL